MVIEEKFHPSGHISEDVEAEEDDDQEGAEMPATVHYESLSVENQDDNQSDDMNDANTKNQDHQPLFITKHNIMSKSLERVLDSLQHCSSVHDLCHTIR